MNISCTSLQVCRCNAKNISRSLPKTVKFKTVWKYENTYCSACVCETFPSTMKEGRELLRVFEERLQRRMLETQREELMGS